MDIELDKKEVNLTALGQAIDSTWGRSSTPKTASYSVKISFAGAGRLLVSYQAVVNFVTEKEMILMKRAYAQEAASVVKATLDAVKSDYKSMTDQGLKFSEVSASDSLEIIGYGVHNPKRTAYFRRKSIVEFA
jgi:hypothetical protein